MDDDLEHRRDNPAQGVSPLAVILPLLIVLVLFSLWQSQKAPVAYPPPVAIGTPWPDFQAAGWLNLADDQAYQLNPTGKVVVIDCMASWCGPCLAEMPKLVKLADQYQPLGVQFVSLTQETKNDVAKIKGFLAASHGANWPFGYGAFELFNTLPINYFPTYLMLVDGKVAWSGNRLEGLPAQLDAALAARR